MSVLLETSLGDLVIDLETEACPELCLNFLKLCKVYYYNLNAFFNVSKDFIAQTGDPTATGEGGESIFSYLSSPSDDSVPRYFKPPIVQSLKHTSRGTVSMAFAGGPKGGCGSQFFLTLNEGPIDYLDGKHPVFGSVVEGLDVLEKMNETFVDGTGRPMKDIRIRHVVILDDPFDDPPGLLVPPSSPTMIPDTNFNLRIADNEDPLETLPVEQAEEERRLAAASASALTLEMIGDLPFANVRPPENVLFVCKLNPVTRDEDLELIFSRFGKIMSCEVIRDKKTGDSLQYAFVEFDKREEAEQAYFKMQNVLVDDRRIWVDFSQSVSKMGGSWGSAALKVSSASNGRGGGGGGGGSRGGSGGARGGGGGGGHRDQRFDQRGGQSSMGMVFDDRDLSRSGSSKGAQRDDRADRPRDDRRAEGRRREDEPRRDSGRDYRSGPGGGGRGGGGDGGGRRRSRSRSPAGYGRDSDRNSGRHRDRDGRDRDRDQDRYASHNSRRDR